MIPYGKTRAQKNFPIDDFSGGVNLADDEAQIREGQLTNCNNLWFSGGRLQLRPGVAVLQSEGTVPEGERVSVRFYDDVFLNFNERRYVPLVQLQDHDAEHAVYEEGHAPQVRFSLVDTATGQKTSLEPFTVAAPYAYDVSYFLFAFGDALYCFLNFCHVMDGKQYKILRVKLSGVEEVEDDDIYVPLVITGGKPVPFSDSYALDQQNLSRRVCKGIGAEGFNMLGSFYRAAYSAFAAECAQQVETDQGSVFRCAMEYPLPKEPCPGGKITAVIKNINGGSCEHTLTVSEINACSSETQAGSDNLKMFYDKRMNTVYFCAGASTTPVYVYNTDFLENNLLLTVQYENAFTAPDRERVFGMKRTAWFGGGGLYGGSRLFLCGNSGDDRAVILWSDLNNPLYFSENNYTFVGDRNQRVTTFGRQGDALIVFKEKEIYQLRYSTAEEISAQSWIESGKSDLSAYAAWFPITQLHASVGCDLPDTVRLCRNRLVWAAGNGSVYTLVTQNPYSESGVWELSRKIRPALLDANLKNAFAVDWEEQYCLVAGNRVFVMHYAAPAFAQVTSEGGYADRIPWFLWTLPLNVETALADGTSVGCVFKNGDAVYSGAWTTAYTADSLPGSEKPIEAVLQTRMIGFAEPVRLDKIVLSGSRAGDEKLNIRLLRSGASQQLSVVPNDRAEGALRAVIHPGGGKTEKLRITVSGRGVFSLDRIRIYYTPAG